jgi:hypothetical protein
MKSGLRCIALFLAALSAQMTLAQGVVRVAPPPPPRNAVAVGRPPHPGYVWTAGYQRWDGRRYVWVPGQWVRPPRGGAVWVPATWTRRGDGWAFRQGYWR